MKIALVHDYLGEFGGAERVLLALSDMFPEAPIYTAFWRPGEAWERFRSRDIRVSWVHHIPGFSTRLHSPLRFLAPHIWGSFDLSSYDVVISSASWYITKGFGTRGTDRKKPVEFCYCHTPPRWLYGYPTSIAWQRFSAVRAYAAIVGFFMRRYDWHAAQRVNYFIANSENTKRRISKFYRRDAVVIYPPVSLPPVPRVAKKDYFLIISRIVGGKGLELAVRAATRLGISLKIAGAAAGYARIRHELQAEAGNTVEFLGLVPDTELIRLYAEAKAFLALASNEDFGMTPVESMIAGTPVIAFRGGGYTESVKDGITGILFDDLSEEGLSAAIQRFKNMRFSREKIVRHARQFSGERFRKTMKQVILRHVTTD